MVTRYNLRRWTRWSIATGALLILGVFLSNFPFDVDAPLTKEEVAKNIEYYQKAYKEVNLNAPPAEDENYVKVAEEAAKDAKIEEHVRDFVQKHGLADKKVLEVGSGRGYLQGIASDYTGLDISPTASRFYHKRFVLGSANSMPFRDSEFDGGWSIWVLEHVPNPEAALKEIRRVMKNNAVFFLRPAWNCNSWAAEGYAVRPYSDFGWQGKLHKASVLVRQSGLYKTIHRGPARMLRYLAYTLIDGPTRLHYSRLEPNYQKYWTNDSDALNSIDRYEAQLWFLSRGDECLNCEGLIQSIGAKVTTDPALIIRVRK